MKPEIRIERIIEGPAEVVFRAWTTPDGMRRWWGPGGYATPYAEIDLRPGGSYLLVMQPPDGEPMRLRGTYREVTRPRRLVYTWQWDRGVPDAQESLVTVEFQDLGQSTKVIVVHGEFGDDSPTAPYESGWLEGLAKLAGYVIDSHQVSSNSNPD